MTVNNSNIVSFFFFGFSVVLLIASFYNQRFSGVYQFPKSHQTDSSHKPRYIFVDLGANSADSLESFLQHKDAKFEFDFPRPDWATHEEAGGYCTYTSGEILLTYFSQ